MGWCDTGQRKNRCWIALAPAIVVWSVASAVAADTPAESGAHVGNESLLVLSTWETMTSGDGLPLTRIRAICLDGDRVWVGTDGGLALREDGRWKAWTVHDGLPDAPVSAIEPDRRTGDLWLGTWGGGLVRFTGGRFDVFHQFNSALAGDLIFDVKVVGDRIWVASNGGISAFADREGTWKLYAERRGDRPDVAAVNLGVSGDTLLAAAWTADVLRYDRQQDHWDRFAVSPMAAARRSHDGSSGPMGVLGLAVAGDTLWSATARALWRREGDGPWTRWAAHDLWGRENVVQCVGAAGDGQAFVGTDRGLHALADAATNTWVTYERGYGASGGRLSVRRDGEFVRSAATSSGICDDRVRCVAATKNEVWVGTVHGLSVGRRPVPLATLLGAGSPASPRLRPARAAAVDPLDREIEVGFVGPATRTLSVPGSKVEGGSRAMRPDLLAIQLAVERANASGGYRGRVPFVVVTAPEAYVFANYGWSAFEDEYLVLARRRPVCGLIAHVAPGRCAATLAALRTETPLINVAGTPPTLDEAISPWVFRAPVDASSRSGNADGNYSASRGGHSGAVMNGPRAILDYVFNELHVTRIAVLHTPGRHAREHLDDWMSYAARKGHPVVMEIPRSQWIETPAEQLSRLRRENVELLLTWCDAATTVEAIRRLREADMTPAIAGSDELLGPDFLNAVGMYAGPVLAAVPCWGREHVANAEWFVQTYAVRNYVGRTKERPGAGAWASFEAATLLMRAVNLAGTDRWAVQRTLCDLTRSDFARLENGAWVYHPTTRGK